MKQRFTALILCISMLVPTIVVAGSNKPTDPETVVNELETLGIEISAIARKVTVEYYIYAIAGFLYDNPKEMGSAEEIARNAGIIENDEEYIGSEYITMEKALKYAVRTLGYGERAELAGGDDASYLNVASELKLTKNVDVNSGLTLNIDDTAAIFYEMLEVEPMTSYMKNEKEYGYRIEKDETLLSLNRDIHKITGIMTGNEYTSIYEADGMRKGHISIDNVEYILQSGVKQDFLGENIYAYVYAPKNDDAQIMYIASREKKNKILSVESGDILYVEKDFSAINYLINDEKEERAKLSPVLKVIYNGKYYSDYTVEDLTPEIGDLKLIDNDTDGKFDIIFVNSYETVSVEYLDKTNKKIFNKFKYEGCTDVLNLSPDDKEITYSIIKGNEEIDFSDLKNDDILTVAKSKEDEKEIIKIFVSDEKLTGIFSGFDYTEEEININGTSYPFTSGFMKFTADKGIVPEPGNEYSFYIDYFGNVVKLNSFEVSDYEVIYKLYEDDEKYYIVYMGTDGEWTSAPMRKNVKLDNETSTPKAVYELLKDEGIKIVKIDTNSEGEIKSLSLPVESSVYLENKFTKTKEAKYTYRTISKSFSNTYYLTDNAKMLIIPEKVVNKEDIELKSASSYFKGDKDYKISAFDIDEFGFTDFVSVVEDQNAIATRVNTKLIVVTDKTQICNQDGEVEDVLVSNVGNLKMYLAATGATGYDAVSVGDIVNVAVNNKGKIDYITKICSLKNFANMDASNYYQANLVVAGVVESVDAQTPRIKINCGKSASFKFNSSFAVQKYDIKRNKCETVTIAEVAPKDRIVLRLSYGMVHEAVLLKDE